MATHSGSILLVITFGSKLGEERQNRHSGVHIIRHPLVLDLYIENSPQVVTGNQKNLGLVLFFTLRYITNSLKTDYKKGLQHATSYVLYMLHI